MENQKATPTEKLGKPKQAAVVIMDVFWGQITDGLISLLRYKNIHYVLVPNIDSIFSTPRFDG